MTFIQKETMIKHFIIAFLLCRILFILYFTFKYRFWSKQPVFHSYNIWYWLFPPGIIEHSSPKLGKFFDRSIITKNYKDLNSSQKSDIYRLIYSHYLQEKNIKYNPTRKSIFKYLQNHDSPAHVSLFYKKKPLYDVSNKQSIISDKLISVITSRPLYCFFHKNEMLINYVDYLCVHKDNRKKGTAPKIIYTHTSRVRNNSKSITFLFKRENDVSLPIIPLSTFYTYGFDTRLWKYSSKPIPQYSSFMLNVQNINTFYHIIRKIKQNKTCVVYPALSNLSTLIKNKLLFIYMLLEKDNPVACYIFRSPFTNYKRENNTGNSIDCIGSFFDKKLNPEIFIYYFYFFVF